MKGEFSYEYTPELARRAVMCFLRRRLGPLVVLFPLVGLVGVVFLFLGIIKLGAALIIIGVPVVICMMWWVFVRRTIAVCRAMPDRLINVRIEPESISFQNRDHSSTIKWSLLKRAWLFPDVLLFFFYHKDVAYSLLPTAPLGEELKQFILDKVKEHGGEVK